MSGERSQCDYHKPYCTHYCEAGHVTADEYAVCDGDGIGLLNANLDLAVTADMYGAYADALTKHLRWHGCKHDFVDVAHEPVPA